MRVSVSKRRRPNGTRGTPEGRQSDARAYIRPLGNARCATPARQKGGDQMTPVGRQRDAMAYIRPLANARCATPATPEGRQGVHPTPWQCTLCHLPMHVVQPLPRKAAETKWHQRDARGTSGRTSDPLPMHVVPRLPRKSGGEQMTPEGRQKDTRAYIRPLANARCATPATPEGRQRDARAYIRPLGNARCATCQCTLCHACHAKAAVAMHVVPRLPRKSGGHQQRRPNGTRGTPEGRQGVHPTPWQCTLCHACHAKAAETKWHQRDARGTPGRTPEPLQRRRNEMAPEGGQDPETTVITFLQGSLFSSWQQLPRQKNVQQLPSLFPACQ